MARRASLDARTRWSTRRPAATHHRRTCLSSGSRRSPGGVVTLAPLGGLGVGELEFAEVLDGATATTRQAPG
jgi:hypothetical protein